MTLPFKIGEPVEKEKNVNYEEIPVEGLRALLAEDNELNIGDRKIHAGGLRDPR